MLEPRHWLAIGEALLSHVSTLLHEHGAAQIVVACADRDLAKAEVLRRSDLTIAANWWTKPLSTKLVPQLFGDERHHRVQQLPSRRCSERVLRGWS